MSESALLTPLQPDTTANLSTGQVNAPEVPKVGTEAPKEEKAPEVVAPTKEEEKLSAKFAALAKAEKETRARKAEMAALQKKLEDEKRELSEKLKKVEEFETKRKRAKEDPWSYLEDGGLTYDELTQMAITGKRPAHRDPRTDSVLSEVERIKAELEESKKAAMQKEEQASVSEWKATAKSTAEGSPEKYELIRNFNAYDVVYELADQKYRSEGVILSQDEALELAEDYYDQQIEDLLAKVGSINKYKSRFVQSAEAAKPKEATPKDSIAKEPKTISNTITSTMSPSDLSMDPDVRRRQVAKMITG